MNMKTRKFALACLFIAMSFIGAHIKVFYTIAFDSLPAFLGVLLLGPFYGAVIGFLGHMFTALSSGFPLSVPVHLTVAFSMAITTLAFYFTYSFLSKRIYNKKVVSVISSIVGIIFNGPISLCVSAPLLIPVMGLAGILAMLPALILAGGVNLILSLVIYAHIKPVWKKII